MDDSTVATWPLYPSPDLEPGGAAERAAAWDKYRSPVKSLVNQVWDLDGLDGWMKPGLTGVGVSKLVFTKAKVFEATLKLSAALTDNPGDAARADALAKTISAAVSCGSTLVFGVLTFGTGVGAVITVFKLAGCVKGVVDAADAWRKFDAPPGEKFQGTFDTSLPMQAVGIGLDTAGFVGDLLGGAAERGMKLAVKQALRRGPAAAGLVGVARGSLRRPWVYQQLWAGSWSRAKVFGSTGAAKALTAFQGAVLATRAGDLVVRSVDYGTAAASTAGGLWLQQEAGHLIPGFWLPPAGGWGDR